MKVNSALHSALREVYSSKPRTVPASKHGAALRAQLFAIALSKSRRAKSKKSKY